MLNLIKKSIIHNKNAEQLSQQWDNIKHFVHIPKTAGTSLKKSFNQVFGDRLFLDYGQRSKATHHDVKKYIYQYKDFYAFQKLLRSSGQSMIAGHNHISKYCGIVKLENTVVMLREPFQRLKSHYQHATGRQDFTGDFETFIKLDANKNLQAKYLASVPLASIGIVGLAEHYDDTVKLISEQWDIQLEIHTENKANQMFELPNNQSLDDLADLARHCNVEDYKFYRAAEKLFANSHYFSKLQIGDRRAACSFDQVNQCLNGWGFIIGSDKPLEIIVQIVDENEFIEAVCNEYKPTLAGKGFSRGGYVGFGLPKNTKIKGPLKLIDRQTNRVLFEADFK